MASMFDVICATAGEEGRQALEPVTGTEVAAAADGGISGSGKSGLFQWKWFNNRWGGTALVIAIPA